MYRILTITVEPSPEHQARILVDGKDWLGPEVLGLDPEMLETELLGKGAGTLLIGRCWSGIVGCHDLNVEVTRTERSVLWTDHGTIFLRFKPAQYDAEVARFAQDKSWETVERTVEREITPVFRGTTIKGGFEFEWVSARERAGLVRLSFRKGGRQRFLKFRWDGASVADAINQAKAFRAERFSHCDQECAPSVPSVRFPPNSGLQTVTFTNGGFRERRLSG